MRAPAYAKINLGLVVGPSRGDGKHEVVTVLQRVDLHDVVEVEGAESGIAVEGFPEDTLVRRALELFCESRASRPAWRARIEKRIPVAAGLGGGSSDAATALRLANELADRALPSDELHEVGAAVGSDVPFFLSPGAKLASGDGTTLTPVGLPTDYWVVLALAPSAQKDSTAAVYAAVDADAVTRGFADRARALVEAVRSVREPRDLVRLPANELVRTAGSALGEELSELGAFRVDASGAGPTVYGLFDDEDAARHAERVLGTNARTWLARPLP